MSFDIPLDAMSIAEKLQAIETIWESIRQSKESIPVPQWHQEVLQQRMERLESGQTQLLDWENVKTRLNNLGK